MPASDSIISADPNRAVTAQAAMLGDLPLWPCCIDATSRPEMLEQHFIARPGLPGVVLMDGGSVLGLMPRSTWQGFMSRPFARELFGKKPIAAMTEIMDRDPLILPHTMPVYAAVAQALARPGRREYDPVLVRDAEGGLSLIEIDILLRAQSQELQETLAVKDGLLAELQRTLSQLQQTQDRLVQAEKMAALGQLVAGIAHEINTPIGVVLTAATHLGERTQALAQILESGTAKRADLSRYMGIAQESGSLIRYNIERAAQLIQSFKQVAVDQTNEVHRRFNVRAYLEQLLASLAPERRKHGAQLHFDCPGDIEMTGFPGALAQVLSNLMANALLHAWPEGQAGMISLTVQAAADQILFCVGDDGAGIPPEILPRIYDPFFTTRRGAGGTGLGLHIVFNIVTETLGGRIDCTSRSGQGTQFTVTLPASKLPPPA